MRLWIDTDIGTNPDDAFALVCAAAHPDVELVGVSTVDGDVEARAAAASELVQVPVVSGAALTPEMIEGVEPDAVLGIGPLTNVARLLERGPRPPQIAVMGGALGPVRHRGAVREVEHNFGTDPTAARVVVELAPTLLVCPLDVTARLRLSPEQLADLLDVAPALAAPSLQWIAAQLAAGVPADEAVLCLHDPLAFLALVGEPVVTVDQAAIVVEPSGAVARRDDGRACDVVVDADVEAAITRVLELVARAQQRPR